MKVVYAHHTHYNHQVCDYPRGKIYNYVQCKEINFEAETNIVTMAKVDNALCPSKSAILDVIFCEGELIVTV